MPSMTITTTAPQAARLAAAMGATMRLVDDVTKQPRDATAAEIKTYVVKFLRDTVQHYERNQAAQAIPAPSAFDPT